MNIIQRLNAAFEKLVGIVLKIYGHPITFLLATIMVIIFLVERDLTQEPLGDIIRDLMLSITFLSFFLIQKAVNKYTAAIHIKMNELVSAHESARNELVNIEEKTEDELLKIAQEFKEKGAEENNKK